MLFTYAKCSGFLFTYTLLKLILFYLLMYNVAFFICSCTMYFYLPMYNVVVSKFMWCSVYKYRWMFECSLEGGEYGVCSSEWSVEQWSEFCILPASIIKCGVRMVVEVRPNTVKCFAQCFSNGERLHCWMVQLNLVCRMCSPVGLH